MPAATRALNAPRISTAVRALAITQILALTQIPALAPTPALAAEPTAPSASSPAPALAAGEASPPAANPTTPSTSNPSPAPEPPTFWTGATNSPVPATIAGGKVINDARQLQSLLKRPETVIVDVSNAPRRPDNLASGAPWLPVAHQAIPGSLWIPGAGLGEIPPAVDDFFRKQLAAATSDDASRRVILYCHQTCWLSWNAAKRAIGYGYHNVYWYRDGIEGWKAAHFPTAVIEPRVAPEE
jgi:PQQ-dependent catabolism-associated CXXCW motif protein